MRIDVLYFASAREAAGVSEESVEVPASARVQDLEPILCALHPALSRGWRSYRFAVDERFAAPSSVLPAHARVALLPPVSGG